MAKPGEYSDVLRIIGQVMDQQGARNVEVVDQGSIMSASWTESSTERRERTYRAFELSRLRDQAHRLRGSGEPAAPTRLTTAEIFRALGAEFDRTATEISSITEAPDGFRVAAVAGGRHYTHTYAPGEITRLVLEQRAQRRNPAPTTPNRPS